MTMTMTITRAIDKLGRNVLVVPDKVARLLSGHQNEGWREFDGVGWGCSRDFPVDHPVSLVAAELDAHMEAAGDLHASVVGEGDWDPNARYWRDYLGNRDLHPRHFSVYDGQARFSG